MKSERGFTTSRVSQLPKLIILEKTEFLLPFYGIVDLDIRHIKCYHLYRFLIVLKLILDTQIRVIFVSRLEREIFHESFNKTIAPFALIHCDVWGPYRTLSSCGASYFLTIVDDYSRAVWTYLMIKKLEVASLLKNFCAMSERQFGKPVKTIQSDNGTKFMVLSSYLQEHGIPHQTSCVDTPR